MTPPTPAGQPPAAVPGGPWDVLVIGGGAAGLLAAIFAARQGSRVLVLETRPTPGAKIRVSGGGRCNVLPSRVELGDFATSGSMHTLRNILFSWPLEEVRRFFEVDLALPLKVEPSGKVFPQSDRSSDVVAALLGECRRVAVEVRGNSRVVALAREAGVENAPWSAELVAAPPVSARRAILATGGLSLPRTGSDGGGLEMARLIGHTLVPTYPALVPLLARDPDWRELSGISLTTRLRAIEGEQTLEEREGSLLFTHRGFSGPVALDMSRYLTRPGSRAVLLAAWQGWPPARWEALLREPGAHWVGALLRQQLPRRLVDLLLRRSDVPDTRRASELRREERARLVRMLSECPLETSGSEGYATAEVTGGGVPLGEVHPRTLESKLAPGLHVCGEALDVIGRIGGYNFLWAWVSGRKAGEAAARR